MSGYDELIESMYNENENEKEILDSQNEIKLEDLVPSTDSAHAGHFDDTISNCHTCNNNSSNFDLNYWVTLVFKTLYGIYCDVLNLNFEELFTKKDRKKGIIIFLFFILFLYLIKGNSELTGNTRIYI